MLIKSITLNNFRQYKGKQIIEFSTQPKKNVTVILGENTCGKTTLVQSFLWCLYGYTEFKDKDLLNAEIKEELLDKVSGAEQTASVAVRLMHDNNEYLIERKEVNVLGDYRKIKLEQHFTIYEVDKYGSATPLESSEYENIINRILPEDLADYFFFWGERIETLSERKTIEEAVKKFLGLDTLYNAIKHLELALRKMNKDKITGFGEEEVNNLQKEIAILEKQNKDYEMQLDSCDNNIEHYTKKADELFRELTTSENRELQSRQSDYANNLEVLKSRREDLENKKRSFKQSFSDSKNFVYYFSASLAKRSVEILKNNPEPVIGWNYIDLNSINEILKKGICICGNEFCEGDDTHKYLIKQKELVAPNVVGGVINSFIESAERRGSMNSVYFESVHSLYKSIVELEDEINELEYETEKLEKLITGKTNLKVTKTKYEDANNKIKEYEMNKKDLLSKQDTNNKRIEELNSHIQLIRKKNKKYIKQARQIAYIDQMKGMFNTDYQESVNTLKAKLTDHVNKNFDEVYSGERKIEIDDKYNARAFNKVGNNWISSETSPGLETVKNFAFISGLLQCAKEKIIADEYEEKKANVFPLVLDAPFSQADEKHVPAISKLIANNAEQIILVVMKKDWNYAREALEKKTGKIFTLDKESETHTVINVES